MKVLIGLLVACCMTAPAHALDWKPWGADGGPALNPYDDAVQAYREGHYDDAAERFNSLHESQPEQVKATYYLAMTRAQQRRYEEARRLYQEVITLDPQSEVGELAREGLDNLPPMSASGLDKPPRFEDAASPPRPLPSSVPQAQTAQMPPQQQLPSGMSGQDLMMLQQVFGGNSNNSNANANSWMPMMMQQQNPADPNSMQPQFNPDLMSTMMMNQMMQNFTLDSGKKDE